MACDHKHGGVNGKYSLPRGKTIKKTLFFISLFFAAPLGFGLPYNSGGGGGGSVSIGGTVVGSTPGGVLFGGTGTTLAQDALGLFYNDTSNFLGIGTAAPLTRLHISSGAVFNDGAGAGIYTVGNSTATAFVGSGDSLTGDMAKRQISITIDGGGSAITTGAKKIYARIPYDMTLTGVDVVADQSGSIVLDVWVATYANFPPTVSGTITASAKPTLSSAQKSQDTTLTGWTTTLTAGSYIEINVDSITTVTKAILNLYGTIR